jgi:hypothetical protein
VEKGYHGLVLITSGKSQHRQRVFAMTSHVENVPHDNLPGSTVLLNYERGNLNCLSGVCGPSTQKKVSSGPHTPNKQFEFPIEIEAF